MPTARSSRSAQSYSLQRAPRHWPQIWPMATSPPQPSRRRSHHLPHCRPISEPPLLHHLPSLSRPCAFTRDFLTLRTQSGLVHLICCVLFAVFAANLSRALSVRLRSSPRGAHGAGHRLGALEWSHSHQRAYRNLWFTLQVGLIANLSLVVGTLAPVQAHMRGTHDCFFWIPWGTAAHLLPSLCVHLRCSPCTAARSPWRS